MLPDISHIQARLHHDELLREAAVRRLARFEVDDPRPRTRRVPQLLRRLAGTVRPVAA